jgi:hypothetical protein
MGGTSLRVSEEQSSNELFGCKTDVMTGDWRKFNNEELFNFYSLPPVRANRSNMIYVVKPTRIIDLKTANV